MCVCIYSPWWLEVMCMYLYLQPLVVGGDVSVFTAPVYSPWWLEVMCLCLSLQPLVVGGDVSVFTAPGG